MHPDSHDAPRPIEIARVDGYHYYALPDGYELSEQHAQITIEPVTVDAVLRDVLCKASPLVQLINRRVCERIAEQYSTTDEIKLLRMGPSAEYDQWNAYVEECRDWGKAEKAQLGL